MYVSGPPVVAGRPVSPGPASACGRVVKVLYTGGTIGMKATDDEGLKPQANLLENHLQKSSIFNDPEYERAPGEERLLVLPKDKKLPCIKYTVDEYELVDSSNMTPKDHQKIADDIERYYDSCDGFVILHGTDTMVHTAATLAFCLHNLGKPVILTGSQIPIYETRSDGRDNLLGALLMAGHYCRLVPEVLIFCDEELHRGVRCSKRDSEYFKAFWSPNFFPLAKLGKISVQIVPRSYFLKQPDGPLHVQRIDCKDAGIIRILTFYPGISADEIRYTLFPPTSGACNGHSSDDHSPATANDPDGAPQRAPQRARGCIIRSFGAGNGPSGNPAFLRVLQEAAGEVIIVNTTQCPRGSVTDAYAAGKALSDAGVISGRDITPEVVWAKLRYVLNRDDWDFATKKQMMEKSIRGEVTEVTDPNATPYLLEPEQSTSIPIRIEHD